MKITLLLSTIGIEFLITFHVSMNASVGMMTRNALFKISKFRLTIHAANRSLPV